MLSVEIPNPHGFLDPRDVWVGAAMALGKLGDVRTVGPLISLLSHRSEFIRRAAADALGKVGDARAVGPLIAAMQAGRIVPQQVVSALEKIDPMW